MPNDATWVGSQIKLCRFSGKHLPKEPRRNRDEAMNNDLEQFSEERLKDMQKHVTAGMTLGHADALLIRQAIYIAIAAKQAKQVGYTAMSELKNTESTGLYFKAWPKDNHAGYSTAVYLTPQPAHTEQVIPSEIPKVPHNGVMAYKKDGSIYSTNYARGWNDCVQSMLTVAPKPESE